MKAWVYRPDRDDTTGTFIFLEEVEIPRPGPEDLLLEILKASVCGTDEALFSGKLRRAAAGVIPGHEFCGRILERGEQVHEFGLGEVVAGESHFSVPGSLDEGIIGLWPPRMCNGSSGRLVNGGYAEYACIPASCARSIPESLLEGPFWPSLFEPAGNDFLLAREVLEGAKPRHAGVIGCGPHGLYAQIFLRHFGLDHILALETDPFRRSFAEGLGAAECVLDPRAEADVLQTVGTRVGAEGFDVTLDMVGKEGQAFEMACRLTRSGGSIFLFGVFSRDYEIGGLAANDIIFERRRLDVEIGGKSLKIIGVTGREGIWDDLIHTVASSKALQKELMKPVTVVGPLDDLGGEIRQHRPNVLKRAFLPFR